MVDRMTVAGSLENPILNSPYEAPAQHFVLGPHGPTGEIQIGRRPSESFIPIPVGRQWSDGGSSSIPASRP